MVFAPEGYPDTEMEMGCSAFLITSKLYCLIIQQGHPREIILHKYRTQNVYRINAQAFECLQMR